MRFQKRTGFSIVELIAVCSCASLLLALMVPAVQTARGNARKRSCSSRLRRIGLALNNYHDVYRSFPPGIIANHTEPSEESWIGWQVCFLPFMDEAKVWKQMRQEGVEPKWPQAFRDHGIDSYRCPADPTGPRNQMRGGFGTSNYSACSGPEREHQWFVGSAEAYWPGMAQPKYPGRSSGLFSLNSSFGARHCVDGTSSTIATVERSVRSGAGLWMGVRSVRHDDDALTDLSHLSGINKSYMGASSLHGPGVNVLFADGSVRFLSDTIDSQPGGGVLQALAGKADGKAVNENLIRDR